VGKNQRLVGLSNLRGKNRKRYQRKEGEITYLKTLEKGRLLKQREKRLYPSKIFRRGKLTRVEVARKT